MQLVGPFYKKYTVEHRALPLIVNIGFQVLFHSPPGVLFTFPSQYFFTIGHQGVFSLGGWSPRLPTGFLVSRGTLDPAGSLEISSTGLSPSMVCFPKTLRLFRKMPFAVLTPTPKSWFGLFPVRSPLLGKSMFLSPPSGT